MKGRVLILGAGGHGQVIAAALLCRAKAGEGAVPVGYLDDNTDLVGQTLLGIPILGKIGQWRMFEHDALVIAVGDN